MKPISSIVVIGAIAIVLAYGSFASSRAASMQVAQASSAGEAATSSGAAGGPSMMEPGMMGHGMMGPEMMGGKPGMPTMPMMHPCPGMMGMGMMGAPQDPATMAKLMEMNAEMMRSNAAIMEKYAKEIGAAKK